MAGANLDFDGEAGIISDINVTPLVDVMLCLLVIFMVTTSYVVADSLKVNLPQASTGDATEPSTLMLTYAIEAATGERNLFLNGERSDEEKIRAYIRQQKAPGKKELQAVIAADKAITHGEVIALIDLVKQEGVVKFALNISSPSQPTPP